MRISMVFSLVSLMGCDLFTSLALPETPPPPADFALYGQDELEGTGNTVVAGDFDGADGPELAVLSLSGRVGLTRGFVALYDGPWSGVADLAGEARTIMTVGQSDTFASVVSGDFDADGIDDLAFSTLTFNPSPSSLDEGHVFVVTGPFPEGRLRAADVAFRWRIGRSLGPHLYEVGDLGGDGADDLVLFDSNTNDLVIIGEPAANGDLASIETRIEVPERPDQVTSGDLDGDGTLDLVVSLPERGFVYGFTALPPRSLTLDDAALTVALEMGEFRLTSVLLADLDNDGLDDLALGQPHAEDGRGRIDVFAGPLIATPTAFRSFVGAPEQALGATLVATGDFDDDGTPDLAAFEVPPDGDTILIEGVPLPPNSDQSAWVLLNVEGEGTRDLATAPASRYAVPEGLRLGMLRNAVAADLNGDGALDLAAGADWALGVGAVYGFLGAGPQ